MRGLVSPSRPKVFVTRQLVGGALEQLSQIADVTRWEGATPVPRELLLERARDADGLLTMLTDRVDAALISSAPRLRVVSNLAVGFDNIDIAACTARKIAVGNTPGVLAETTADFAFALLLGAARRLVEAEAYVRQGRWQTWDPHALLGRDVHGATLGIAGMGAIGDAVARRAAGFGMRVLYTSRSPRPGALGTRVEKESLLQRSDYLSLHLPLTPQTHHWIGAAELAQMKPSAVLINTARGKVVDQAALVAALRAGRPALAALDVTDPEPISADDPLLTLPNVILAPHIASASHQTRAAMAKLAVNNILAVLEGGRPVCCVNPEVFGS